MWDQRNNSDLAQQLVSWRRNFHSNPEVSWEEKRTSEVIVDALRDMGVEVQTFPNHFGICGIIRGKNPGPVVVFRTDMDALPITEANDVSYRSRNEGVMHACGHDGHMAIALGIAKLFSSCRKKLVGTIKIVFQPAEEAAPSGGAAAMIKEGVLDDADVIFGLHLWPDLPCGHIGVRPGPLMAASDRFTIKILGQGAHAGQPQNGVDSITIASDVIQGLGHIMSRQIDPLETATMSIGTIQGGERYNVIARKVVIDGTVRTLGENVRKEIPSKMKRLLDGMCASQGGEYTLDYQYGYPVLNNWAEPTEMVIDAAKKIAGTGVIHDNVKPVLASEDFGRYLTNIPGAYFWLGCAKDGEVHHSLHSPNFDINEDALLVGAQIMYQIGRAALTKYNKKEELEEREVVTQIAAY
ncbi:amidohydrolase [Pelosinus sp. IPA-1]|uniref:M20 metallopeptidase family protein n=1 Tax=Pelosinus sp. IPA-1 TaxID=3029569 RepID=UPI002436299B|nr:amidohydrolase [Pelosinus sp. IPA-1]GMA98015.1 peptidase M20 [Pelosinus sp. IPA-1]